MRKFIIILSVVVLVLLSCEKEKTATSLELTVKYNDQILPNWTINAHKDWDDEIFETQKSNANGIVIFDNLQDKLPLHNGDSTSEVNYYAITLTGKLPNDSISTFYHWIIIEEGENLKEELIISK